MNKKQFFKELKLHLKNLQDDELKEIIGDYEEHIEIGVSKGRDEKEVIKALGKPKAIAKNIIANYYVEKAKNEKTTKSILRAVLATGVVGFFNLVFILGPFLFLLGVLIAIWVTGISFFIVGVGGLIALILHFVEPGIPFYAAINFLISAISGGIIIVILSYYLSKLFGNLTLKYLKLNLKVIKKMEEVEEK